MLIKSDGEKSLIPECNALILEPTEEVMNEWLFNLTKIFLLYQNEKKQNNNFKAVDYNFNKILTLFEDGSQQINNLSSETHRITSFPTNYKLLAVKTSTEEIEYYVYGHPACIAKQYRFESFFSFAIHFVWLLRYTDGLTNDHFDCSCIGCKKLIELNKIVHFEQRGAKLINYNNELSFSNKLTYAKFRRGELVWLPLSGHSPDNLTICCDYLSYLKYMKTSEISNRVYVNLSTIMFWPGIVCGRLLYRANVTENATMVYTVMLLGLYSEFTLDQSQIFPFKRYSPCKMEKGKKKFHLKVTLELKESYFKAIEIAKQISFTLSPLYPGISKKGKECDSNLNETKVAEKVVYYKCLLLGPEVISGGDYVRIVNKANTFVGDLEVLKVNKIFSISSDTGNNYYFSGPLLKENSNFSCTIIVNNHDPFFFTENENSNFLLNRRYPAWHFQSLANVFNSPNDDILASTTVSINNVFGRFYYDERDVTIKSYAENPKEYTEVSISKKLILDNSRINIEIDDSDLFSCEYKTKDDQTLYKNLSTATKNFIQVDGVSSYTTVEKRKYLSEDYHQNKKIKHAFECQPAEILSNEHSPLTDNTVGLQLSSSDIRISPCLHNESELDANDNTSIKSQQCKKGCIAVTKHKELYAKSARERQCTFSRSKVIEKIDNILEIEPIPSCLNKVGCLVTEIGVHSNKENCETAAENKENTPFLSKEEEDAVFRRCSHILDMHISDLDAELRTKLKALFLQLLSKKDSNIYQRPVSHIDAPDSIQNVKNPLDLLQIGVKLDLALQLKTEQKYTPEFNLKAYGKLREFLDDMENVFLNSSYQEIGDGASIRGKSIHVIFKICFFKFLDYCLKYYPRCSAPQNETVCENNLKEEKVFFVKKNASVKDTFSNECLGIQRKDTTRENEHILQKVDTTSITVNTPDVQNKSYKKCEINTNQKEISKFSYLSQNIPIVEVFIDENKHFHNVNDFFVKVSKFQLTDTIENDIINKLMVNYDFDLPDVLFEKSLKALNEKCTESKFQLDSNVDEVLKLLQENTNLENTNLEKTNTNKVECKKPVSIISNISSHKNSTDVKEKFDVEKSNVNTVVENIRCENSNSTIKIAAETAIKKTELSLPKKSEGVVMGNPPGSKKEGIMNLLDIEYTTSNGELKNVCFNGRGGIMCKDAIHLWKKSCPYLPKLKNLPKLKILQLFDQKVVNFQNRNDLIFNDEEFVTKKQAKNLEYMESLCKKYERDAKKVFILISLFFNKESLEFQLFKNFIGNK
ncbi:hypothetical protein HK099_004220, partial [Clydaea vesicula]